MQMQVGKHPTKFMLYISTRKFTIFFRHSAQPLLYFPQNVVRFIILPFFIPITFFFHKPHAEIETPTPAG